MAYNIRKVGGTYANGNGQTIFMNKANDLEKSNYNTVFYAVEKTIEELKKAVKKNISKKAHSPYELKKLDHPFAERHERILKHGHRPLWSVHKVSGDMLSSLEDKVIDQWAKRMVIGLCGWDAMCPDEVKHVIFGTEKMLKRPILKLTAMSIGFDDMLRKNLITYSRRGTAYWGQKAVKKAYARNLGSKSKAIKAAKWAEEFHGGF